MTLTVGSLFSGIGGLDLGLERAGMRVVWQSEIDPYACRVLAKHWPDVPNLGDITTVDWSSVDRPDLVCGGYPCQPFSLAGTRNGDTDPRHLWPHMRDAIRRLRPRWALLENVPGHLSLGFGRVLGDLAECGYDCEWDCIPAAAVGAPHLRYRVFVVAHTDQLQHQGSPPPFGGKTTTLLPPHTNGNGEPGGTDDAVETRLMVPDPVGDQLRLDTAVAGHDGTDRDVADTEGDAGWISNGDGPTDVHHWTVEPDVGRVAHGVPHRVDRLRCLGNAVVPQVAEWIGQRIMEAALCLTQD